MWFFLVTLLNLFTSSESYFIKICTDTCDAFDTFLQKVKNTLDWGGDCLHFDTSNRTQSYQKDRKCQSVKSVMSFFY